MSKIGDSERQVQNRVIDFFRKELHYDYIGDLHDKNNSNIIDDRLMAYLINKGYKEKTARAAVNELKKDAANMQQGLYAANLSVYNRLKYGIPVRESAEASPVNVYCIDFNDITKNDFAIAEEVTVIENSEKRPDIVIYVNGIAVAVIELKNSRVSVAEGIRQNNTNQKSYFIERFFTTMQICAAANESEGVWYGTLRTAEKFYLKWKEDGFKEHQDERDETDVLIEERCKEIEGDLYKDLYCIFYKKRFLDIIHNFVIFDNGRKKLCRYNQYYAIKRSQNRLMQKKQGGIIWHTQGSGKSLTMVWLSKWVLANEPDARVLIVTDREELDDQIEKLYKGVNVNIRRTKSGKDLIERLNAYDDRMLCSLIHKFGKKGVDTSEKDYNKYIEELLASLPKGFKAKGKIYVFVDECHRTQSGKLHSAMKAILPESIFIGFTGTPLLKKDKKTSLEVFGSYIHSYKFNEGVADGVILDLRYEAREVPQDITSEEKVNQWFDIKTKGLAPRAKARLKERWGTLQKMFSSKDRLEKIANDIIVDFERLPRLADGRGNAMLVAENVYSACRFYEIFQSKGFKKCAIISSYKPYAGDLRTDTVSDDEDTDTFTKYDIYNKMLDGKTVEDFEAEAKRRFINEPANMKLLIVIDKLLTGFDAPPCTYLYIDKKMQDHGLFQAICRVNRLHDESKEFGYVVDYKELFSNLEHALNKYTAGAFENYDEKDVDGLLKDRSTEAKKHFYDILDELEELCEGVEPPKDSIDYIRYFCGESSENEDTDGIYEKIREKLYSLVNALVRAFAEFKQYFDECDISSSEAMRLEKKVEFYLKLSGEIGRASGDYIDLKKYEPGMRFLIDNYITAYDSERLGILDDFTLLDFIIKKEAEDELDDKEKESVAEIIENNIRRKIVEKTIVNPAYYAEMSEILQKLIDMRKKKAISYKELLKKYAEAVEKVEHPERDSRYPESVRTSAALRALFDAFGEDEVFALQIHNAVLHSKQDGFRYDDVKRNRIKKSILKIVNDKEMVENIYALIEKQEEY